MSYRDEKQSLKEPLHKILEGIKEFSQAVDHRVESNEWDEDYIESISQIDIELRQLKARLSRLKNDNW